MVFQLADGTKTAAEISDLISAKLKTSVREDLVWLAVDGLKKDNLLENADKLINHFAGLSRREAIKKVGLASLVMLPIVVSLIALKAVTAASCAANGAACTFSNNTQSNCCNSNQRCLNSVCTNCFAASRPLASCQTAGCCNLRSDRNLCCSGTYNETQVGEDFVCRCA